MSLAVPLATGVMFVKRQPSLPRRSHGTYQGTNGLPQPVYILLLSLQVCPTLWGPVIQPQSKVAKFGRLAKIGQFTVLRGHGGLKSMRIFGHVTRAFNRNCRTVLSQEIYYVIIDHIYYYVIITIINSFKFTIT